MCVNGSSFLPLPPPPSLPVSFSRQWINWEDRITGTLPPARSAHGACVYANHLWIFAGYDGHARLNDMWRIDLSAGQPQWEQIQQTGDSPPTCCNFPVAVVDDSMYVFSGQSGAKITNNLYQFVFGKRRWIRIRTEHLLRGSPSPPQRRYGHAMVAYGHCLYVFGGAADGILDNEVHCFDVDSRLWSVIQPSPGSDTPCGRVFHSAAVWNNALYIFGGTIDSLSNRSGDLHQFCFASFPKCTLVADFLSLLQAEQFTDTHFLVDGGHAPIKAHAAVVAARSPFLCRKILAAYEETKAAVVSDSPPAPRDADSCRLPAFLNPAPLRVSLPGVSGESLNMALYSIYTDRIHPDLENHSREGMSMQQMLLMIDVYKLSMLLETKRLELLSLQYIEASINVENALLVLHNASELRLSSLKEYCLRFIVRDSNYRKVVMSTAFESLDPPLMVQVVRRQVSRSRPTSPDPHAQDELPVPSSLQEDLREFLLSDAGRPFTDIALQIGGEVVYAHRPVLAARCGYFEALFRSFMPENHTVEVTFGKNVPSMQAFLSLLKYVYHGEVKMPPEDSLYIFSAPNFFGFSNARLHSYCKAHLERNVNEMNVVRILEVADAIDLQVMKRHCLSVISGKFPAFVRQADFRSLPRGLLLDIFDVLASRM